jgi:hypothetical protein
MSDTEPDLGHWANRQFTQVAALIMVIVGFGTADAYSLTAGIAVWSVAFVFLVGSFFIEKDLSPHAPPDDGPVPGAPGQGTT